MPGLVPKLNEDYELAKSHAVKGKEVVFATSSPHWLAALDDLRTPKWVELVEYPGLTLQDVLEFTR